MHPDKWLALLIGCTTGAEYHLRSDGFSATIAIGRFRESGNFLLKFNRQGRGRRGGGFQNLLGRLSAFESYQSGRTEYYLDLGGVVPTLGIQVEEK